MQLLHRVRWLVRLMMKLNLFITSQIAKRHEKLKTIKRLTSDSSLSASSKRHFARDGSFSAFSSTPQISRYISRIQHVFVIALQHLASFLGTFGLYGQFLLISSTFRHKMFSAFPGISQKLMDYTVSLQRLIEFC